MLETTELKHYHETLGNLNRSKLTNSMGKMALTISALLERHNKSYTDL